MDKNKPYNVYQLGGRSRYRTERKTESPSINIVL